MTTSELRAHWPLSIGYNLHKFSCHHPSNHRPTATNLTQVLAAFNGGKIDLFGSPVQRRWVKLSASATANTTGLTVEGGQLGWAAGQQVLVTSSSWNPWQASVDGCVRGLPFAL